MYYSDLVKKAATISFDAQKDQLDKAGHPGYPYFMHPLTLALQFDDEATVCVALLHDVVEDHGDKYPMSYMEKEFPKEVVVALKLLTHDKHVDYIEYVKKIKTNPIARKVKIADLKHNTNLRRTGGYKPHKYNLYLEALKILEE